MKTRFLHEPIAVEFQSKPGPPVSFTWQGRRHQIVRVRRTWFDYGWGPLRPGWGRWWQRRHRTYYVVETEEGAVYELYLDRGSGRWTLSKELSSE